MTQHTQEVEHPHPEPVARVTSGLRANLPQFLLLAHAAPPAPSPRPYAPPIGIILSEGRALSHQKAIQDIARERFAFPTPKYGDYKTYTNVPQRSMGIQMSNGAVAYPDIVIVQSPENFTKIIGQVETRETVNEEVARHEWRPYSQLAPLYLYVPVGKGDEARTLCRRFNIPVVGIRTWRYAVGYEEMEITDHFTQWTGPEDLLPGILKPR